VARHDLPFEFMLNAMRLIDGVPARWFVERTGLPPTAIEAGLAEAERRGLLRVGLDRWQPTALGARFLNDLQAVFLADR
jgi:oxygen-independent coproporphyrinogen-3 oxidase